MKALRISALAALASVLFSCIPASIDPLEGIYPERENHSFTSAVLTSSEKVEDLFHFVVDLGEGSNKLQIEFVSNSWFLPAGSYNPMPTEEAKKGNYTIEGSSYNGKKMGKNGLLYVEKDEDNYSIKGNIWVEDGTVLAIDWAGVLTGFVKPKPVYKVAVDTVVDPMVVSDMTGASTTFDGVAEHFITVCDQKGTILAKLDLTAAAGASLVGEYNIVNALNAPGQANNGWDISMWVPGMFGGCMVYQDGEPYIITEGKITVTATATGGLTFVGSGLKSTKVGGSDPGPNSLELEETYFDNGYTCVVNAGPLTDYSTGQGVEVAGVVDNNIVIMGAEGQVANVDVSTVTGDGLTGTYPVTATFNAAGLANNGGSFYGMFDYGTWYKSGETVNYLTSGEVIISEVEGGYNIVAGSAYLGICKVMM